MMIMETLKLYFKFFVGGGGFVLLALVTAVGGDDFNKILFQLEEKVNWWAKERSPLIAREITARVIK